MGRFCSRLTIPACIAAIAVLSSPLRADAQSASTIALCKDDRTEKGLAACNAILKQRIKADLQAATYNNRALTLLALNRSAESVRDYDEAIKIAPGNAKLHGNRARARFAAGDQEGAIADFSEAIERDPFEAEYYAGLGYIKLMREDFDGARATLRKGLFWHNDNARCAYILGLLDYRTGHYDDAISNVSKAKANGFASADVLVTRSLAFYRRGAYVPAENDATEGLKDNPENAGLFEARARIRLSLGRPAEALADAEQAVKFAPKYGRAYATRSSIRLTLKDNDGAKADADKAIELDPKLLDAYLAKADALLALGDRQQARSVYQGIASRTDVKDAQDIGARDSAAAKIIELDAPKPVVVSELDETALRQHCESKDDPLRMRSCDRLVETAADAHAKAQMLVLRSQARPYGERMADLELAVAAAPDDLDILIERARGYLVSYRYDADMTPLERGWRDADSVVKRAEPNSKALKNGLAVRAQAASGLGRYDEGIADLARLMDIDHKNDLWALSVRARDNLMAGHAEAALLDARQAKTVSLATKDGFFANGALVLALIETGRIDEAFAELDDWKARQPGFNVDREVANARALLARGDDQAALTTAEAALKSKPRSGAALAVHGIASARLGRSNDAISDLTAVVEKSTKVNLIAAFEQITPGFAADVFAARGQALATRGRLSEAVRDFSEVISRMPDRAAGYGERAQLAFQMGEASAVTDVVAALRIEPNAPRWQALAARITLRAGDAETAEKMATQALSGHPADKDLLSLRARARVKLGNFAGAATDAETQIAAMPDDVEARLALIDARTGLGNPSGALQGADAAHAAIPSDQRIFLALGDAKAKNGDVAGAIGVFEEAARQSGSAIKANKRLGDLYVAIGSDQLALGYYAKAIELTARDADDTKTSDEARAARDQLIRKATAPK